MPNTYCEDGLLNHRLSEGMGASRKEGHQKKGEKKGEIGREGQCKRQNSRRIFFLWSKITGVNLVISEAFPGRKGEMGGAEC